MNPDRALLVETSGRIGRVGLAEGTRIIEQRPLSEARRHARDLAPAVLEMLHGARWAPGDIGLVVAGLGPGSYTGLRVGITSAKTFAYATGAMIIGTPTFDIIAAGAPAGSQSVEVIADGQKERVYVQRFRATGCSDYPVAAETELSVIDVIEYASQLTPGTTVLGPALRKFRERLPAEARILEEKHWDPTLENLLRLGRCRAAQGCRDDVFRIAPIYQRPSAAEEQWQALGRP